MICIDINLKLFFDDVPVNSKDGDRAGAENEFKELFDDIFGEREEYIRTEVKIGDIKEVE